MKDYIAGNYPEKMSYNNLREAVLEAWKAISTEELGELVRDMPHRCQAVIDVSGGHIPY